MFDELCKLLREQLRLKDGVEITPDSRIIEDLGADSLDVLQLLMTIEETRGIVIPDEKLAGFTVVRDIVDYLENLDK